MNARDGAPELSWVLPLYRTTAQLAELVARIHAVCDAIGVRRELVLVDDACPEGCGTLADAIAERDPTVQVVHHPANRGQDAALRAGLAVARGEWSVVLDADLQDPPEGVVRMWALRNGVDAVFARRTGRYTTPGRRLTSWMYRIAVAVLGGLPRGAGLYVLMHRSLVAQVCAPAPGASTLLALIARTRPRSAIVAVERERRRHGRSAYSSRRRTARAARSIWQLLRVRQSRSLPVNIEDAP